MTSFSDSAILSIALLLLAVAFGTSLAYAGYLRAELTKLRSILLQEQRLNSSMQHLLNSGHNPSSYQSMLDPEGWLQMRQHDGRWTVIGEGQEKSS